MVKATGAYNPYPDVTDLDDYRPAGILVDPVTEHAHVVLVQMMEDIASGKLKPEQIEGSEDLFRALAAHWLQT